MSGNYFGGLAGGSRCQILNKCLVSGVSNAHLQNFQDFRHIASQQGWYHFLTEVWAVSG